MAVLPRKRQQIEETFGVCSWRRRSKQLSSLYYRTQTELVPAGFRQLCQFGAVCPCRAQIRFHVVNGGAAVDTVAQVKNVPSTSTGLQAGACRGFHLGNRTGADNRFGNISLKNQMRVIATRPGQIVLGAQRHDWGASSANAIQIGAFLHEQNAWDTGHIRNDGLVDLSFDSEFDNTNFCVQKLHNT